MERLETSSYRETWTRIYGFQDFKGRELPTDGKYRTCVHTDIGSIKAIFDGESARIREKGIRKKGGKRSRGRCAILEEKSLVRKKKEGKKGRKKEKKKKTIEKV